MTRSVLCPSNQLHAVNWSRKKKKKNSFAVLSNSLLILHQINRGLLCCFSYRWIRFEVCRPGDGQVPHSLSEDDASVNFDAYQRRQGYDENIKTEHVTGCLNIIYMYI